MIQKSIHWFAVQTRPRWEKKVAASLGDKGIEHYCPLHKVARQWSDRRKIVHEPLFKSYVFIHIEEDKKWEVKKINGILNYVYWLGKPATIRDEEIFTIRKFLNEFSDIRVEGSFGLQVNSKVRIKQGLLMNYQGILIEVYGNRAKVRIETLGVQLSAQFDKKNLEAISP